MAPDRSAFPVWSVGPCLEATAGIPFAIRPVTSLLLPWRTFALYIPLQDLLSATTPPSVFHNVRWHFRVCKSGWYPGAEATLWNSQVPKQETIGPLAACSTPGGLGDNAVWEGDPSCPPPYLFGPGV